MDAPYAAHAAPILLAGLLGRRPPVAAGVEAAWAAFTAAWCPPYDLQAALMAGLDALARLVPADGYFAYAAEAPDQPLTLRAARAEGGVPVVGPDYSGLVTGGLPRPVPLELPGPDGTAARIDGTSHEPYLAVPVGTQVVLRAALTPARRAPAHDALPAAEALADRLLPVLQAILHHTGVPEGSMGSRLRQGDGQLLGLVCRLGARGLGAVDAYLAVWDPHTPGAPDIVWEQGEGAALAASCPPRPLHGQLHPPAVVCWEAPDLPGRLAARGDAAFVFIPVRGGLEKVGAMGLSLPAGSGASARDASSRLARTVTGVLTEQSLTDRWAQGRLQVLLLALDLLEAQDPHTEGHSARVARLSEALAREAGLPPPDREAARLGGRLHDIGMIGVDMDVRPRPGGLSEPERERVRVHPALGAEFLRGMPPSVIPPEVTAAVRHHHERWDGGGYPDRLAREAIPPVARVVACAEVLVARGSRRAYRAALAPAEVARLLQEGTGTLFEPEIASAAARLLERGWVI